MDKTAFVQANTTLRPVPGIPEILLHQSDDAFTLWERTEVDQDHPDQQPPFWGFAWAGGLAIARYLLDHPETVKDRSVLDLGSGSGLTAIAAALAGARAVTASELDPFAVAAITINAAANHVAVTTTGDVLDTEPTAEAVLAADIWYEKQLARRALRFLERARATGAQVLIGDIGRAFLPRAQLRQLAAYEVPVNADLENTTTKKALILTLNELPPATVPATRPLSAEPSHRDHSTR